MANIKRANASSITKSGVAIADVPDAPTIGAVTDLADGSSVTVAYTAAVTGGTATTFTATSTPGSLTGTGTSPITVTGLSAGTAYTFKVKGTNSTATGPESAASASVTPVFPPLSAYDSIATTTVSTAVSSITFSSIPQTYTHLQIRAVTRDSRATTPVNTTFTTFNGDTGSNYAYHAIYGDGDSSASATGAGTQINAVTIQNATASSPANVFAACITDILDYSSTSKNKTMRSFAGCDNNGTGRVAMWSSLWMNSASGITSITFTPAASATFSQYTEFSLYGIKGA